MMADKIPDEIMREAWEIALAARKLVRNTIDAIAVEEMLRDRILAGLLAERLHGDTAARKECVEIAREAQRMRERLFSENEASINAHRAMQAMEIADAIEATIGGKQG